MILTHFDHTLLLLTCLSRIIFRFLVIILPFALEARSVLAVVARIHDNFLNSLNNVRMQNSCISSYNSKMYEKKIVNLVVRVRAIRTYVQIVLRGHLWSSVVLGTQLILFYHFVYINTLHINTACVWWIWLIERIYKSFHSHTLSLAFVLCFSKIPNCNVSRFLSLFFFGKQKMKSDDFYFALDLGLNWLILNRMIVFFVFKMRWPAKFAQHLFRLGYEVIRIHNKNVWDFCLTMPNAN